MNPAGSPLSLFGPPLSRTRDLLGRYAFALLAVAVAAGMRYLLQVFFGFTSTYTTFYSAIMVVAVLGGLGPGLAATLLSCLAAAYFFVEPRGSFAIAAVGDKIALAAFLATGAAISLLAEFMRRRNAELSRNKLDLSNAQAIAQVGSWHLDIADHKPIWSEETYRLFHVPLETPLSIEKFFACVHPEDSSTVSQAWSAALLGARYDLEHRILVDGQTRWVHQRAKIALDTAGKPRFATGAVQDITQRKCAEQRLQRLNRTLQSLSECADALMRATDECAVLQQVCDSVVQVGGYRMSWVGYIEHDEYRSVRSVAQAGFEEGYLNKANISWADVERGRGPTGTSIRTGKVVVANDAAHDPSFVPWRQEALQRRYRSSIALPLRSEKEVFGALTIYSDEAAAFDSREQRLLEELANNLTYAILTLRAHAGRDRAQEALRRSEAQLKEAQRVARLGSWNRDRHCRGLDILGAVRGSPDRHPASWPRCHRRDDRTRSLVDRCPTLRTEAHRTFKTIRPIPNPPKV